MFNGINTEDGNNKMKDNEIRINTFYERSMARK